jgi:hypothetical protein
MARTVALHFLVHLALLLSLLRIFGRQVAAGWDGWAEMRSRIGYSPVIPPPHTNKTKIVAKLAPMNTKRAGQRIVDAPRTLLPYCESLVLAVALLVARP